MNTLLLIAALVACDSTPPAAPAPEAPTEVAPAAQSAGEKASAIAKKIKAAPDNAEAILKEAGMSREDFDKLLFDVAADPAEAKRYTEALR